MLLSQFFFLFSSIFFSKILYSIEGYPGLSQTVLGTARVFQIALKGRGEHIPPSRENPEAYVLLAVLNLLLSLISRSSHSTSSFLFFPGILLQFLLKADMVMDMVCTEVLLLSKTNNYDLCKFENVAGFGSLDPITMMLMGFAIDTSLVVQNLSRI